MSEETLPRRFGRYELLAQIGSGGASAVYLGRVPVVGGVHRDVAIKLMHAGIADADAQLVAEARIAARIRHANVVPVLEAGIEQGRVYLVMEWVEGDSLLGLLRRASSRDALVPLPIVGRILADALAGLHAAHELRGDDGALLDLVHRDFTPHNVLVGTDGVTRLIDFGIAKTLDGLGLTGTGLIKGKVRYMAPEQALGRSLDRRCDVWAAGVVAWELLAGRRMVRAENEAAALLEIVTQPPPRLSSVRPDIPSEIDAVIAAALEQDRERRLPTADAFRERVIAAWRLVGGMAEPAEVGAYVREEASERLSRLGTAVRNAATSLPPPAAHTASVTATKVRRRRGLKGALVLLATAGVAAGVSWFAARATTPAAVPPAEPAPPAPAAAEPAPPAALAPAPATTTAKEPEPAPSATQVAKPARAPVVKKPPPRGTPKLPGLAPLD